MSWLRLRTLPFSIDAERNHDRDQRSQSRQLTCATSQGDVWLRKNQSRADFSITTSSVFVCA